MPVERLVLDTSAILSVLEREPEAQRVLELLDDATAGRCHAYTAFLAVMEVEYILIRRLDQDSALNALSLLENWPVEVIQSNPSWRHDAATLKARGGVSLADAWVASLAMRLDADLIHKDSEFDSVPGLRSVRL